MEKVVADIEEVVLEELSLVEEGEVRVDVEVV